MKSILIRDIDEQTLDSLKRLARYHHRSLQGELHALIHDALRFSPGDEGESELDLVTVNLNSRSSFSRQDIYDDEER